jgi:hypothetical protein
MVYGIISMNNIKNQGLMIPSKNYQKLLLTAGLIYNMSYIPVIIYNINTFDFVFSLKKPFELTLY